MVSLTKMSGYFSSERSRALIIAAKVLERPHEGRDEDIVVLARQLLRSQDELDCLMFNGTLKTGSTTVSSPDV